MMIGTVLCLAFDRRARGENVRTVAIDTYGAHYLLTFLFPLFPSLAQTGNRRPLVISLCR